MDEKTDAQLGTAIKLLYHRGEHKAVNMLLAAKDILWEFDQEDWSINYFEIGIVVDVDSYDQYNNDELLGKVADAFRDVMRPQKEGVTQVRLYPAQVQGDWRKDIEAHLRGKPKNQASLVALPDRFPVRDYMRFRDKAELVLYEALKEKQHSLPVTDTITIAPNASVRVLGHTWEPDFLVVYRGRTGVIEVDGGSHPQEVRI
jgi:hypothetical protein